MVIEPASICHLHLNVDEPPLFTGAFKAAPENGSKTAMHRCSYARCTFALDLSTAGYGLAIGRLLAYRSPSPAGPFRCSIGSKDSRTRSNPHTADCSKLQIASARRCIRPRRGAYHVLAPCRGSGISGFIVVVRLLGGLR
ncbi:Dsim\GD11944-PA-like protein [Anopheles sinensis]|uniref:Dsim\GD11944-PA-like protein n=1 Tax=Anopheles sinensis TaxID=74873 RepID=A0A084WG13_ANOSI|nr:Dsim\GD11944-PA-like protein [Anopheles sinensis]